LAQVHFQAQFPDGLCELVVNFISQWRQP